MRLCERCRQVKRGTHAELLTRGGESARLWQKQSGVSVTPGGARAEVELSWLRTLPFFQGVTDATLAEIRAMFATERCPEGRTVVYEGDPGDRFYVIVRGRVVVEKKEPRGPGDRPVLLDDGDYFGELALLRDGVRTASVRTVTPCIFLALSREQFRVLLEKVPGLGDAMARGYLGTAVEATAENLRAP